MMKKQFDTWKIMDFQNQKVKMLWGFIGILCVIILLLWSSTNRIKDQLKNQRIYLTPAQVLQGGYYKTNSVSNAFVYGFAYQMFVAINTWSDNAQKDYKKNIIDYRYYITPSYRSYLNNDYENSFETGNLLDSVQTIAPYNGMGYVNGNQVKRTGDNSWVVDLRLRVTRYKDNAVLMDALYEYKVRVVRAAESIQYNPWGLVLDGLVSKKRLQTFV